MKQIVAIALLASASAFANPKSEAEAHSQAFQKAYNARDLDAITAAYTPDATLMGPFAGHHLVGQKAIREFFSHAGESTIALKTVEAWPAGKNQIFEISTWDETVKTPDGKTQVLPVRAQELLVKQGGHWLTKADTFAVLMPMPPAPQANAKPAAAPSAPASSK